MIITSHMQNIIQIYLDLLKLSRKQDTILNIGDARPDHNFFVFRDGSMIFRMWVHDHKAVCRVP
jgi:hypothetical protein